MTVVVPSGHRLLTTSDPIGATVEEVLTRVSALDEPRLAVPGGSASRAVGGIRGSLGSRWGDVRLTYTDERCVAWEDPESTRGTLHREGLLADDDPPRYELPLYRTGEDPSAAAVRAGRTLDERFGGALDVVLLGMGPDGHVASIFPGLPVVNEEGLVGYVTESPKPPPRRVTLTRRLIARCTTRIVVAFGESKRDALRRTLAADPALPLTGCGELIIVTDLNDLEG